MAKLYIEDAFVGEELSERVPLDQWVARLVQQQTEPVDLHSFVQKTGKYFTDVLSTPPEGIVRPRRLEPFQCHHNNIFYGVVLFEEQPDVLKDFKFVSEFYGMRAIVSDVPQEKKYFIARHTFMTYKNAVLDYTVLQYPPRAYQVDQYFGVSFDVEVMVRAVDKLFENGDDIGKVPILKLLHNEHYSKE